MSRLIDGADLMDKLDTLEQFNADVPEWVKAVIKGMPEAVVYCRDCVHFCPHMDRENTCNEAFGLITPLENDFCPYGKRKQ